jgi:hypothetical protein
MQILDDRIVFEHLTQPSRDMIGDTVKIEASKSFVSSNAKGNTREVDNLVAVEELGKTAGDQLLKLFS